MADSCSLGSAGVPAQLPADRWPHGKRNCSQLALIDTPVARLQREVRERVGLEDEHMLAARGWGRCPATSSTTATLLHVSTRLITNILAVLALLGVPQPGFFHTPALGICPHPPHTSFPGSRCKSLSLLPSPTFSFFFFFSFRNISTLKMCSKLTSCHPLMLNPL